MLTLIYFLLVLGVVVFIHELGHFLFAKKAGIYVYEFSLGMGPRLFKWKRKNDETEYSIRLLPIGGYVQMAGEEVEVDEKIPENQRMQSKSKWQRFLVMVAGVLFNFILAIILLFIVALVQGAPQNKPYIQESIIEQLETGDLITSINGKKIHTTDRFMIEYQVHIGETLTLEVNRNGNTKTVQITPTESEENGEKLYHYGFSLNSEVKTGFWTSLQYAFTKTFSLVGQMIIIIWYLITGQLGLNNLAGPIGIYNVVGQTAALGFINILYLIGFISINVGFINLLPFPAFDGGRILFLLIEAIKGKPVNPKVENTIHNIGFLLLMALMIAITYNDIMNLIR